MEGIGKSWKGSSGRKWDGNGKALGRILWKELRRTRMKRENNWGAIGREIRRDTGMGSNWEITVNELGMNL